MAEHTPPFRDRLWARVSVGADNECWPWLGPVSPYGYGQVTCRSRRFNAHRVVWELTNGAPIPAGLFVIHSCDNPPCVNPAHLRVGTPAENSRDMVNRGRHSNRKAVA